MLQELGAVKQELNTALKKMEDLDAKLNTTSNTAHSEYLVSLYQQLTGIHLAIDEEEKVHIQVNNNHLIMKEEDDNFLFDPVLVVSSDLSEQMKVKKDGINEFMSFLKSQQ